MPSQGPRGPQPSCGPCPVEHPQALTFKTLSHPTHWSLQMQMTGLIKRPPSARDRRPSPANMARPPSSASFGPLRSMMLRSTLMAA